MTDAPIPAAAETTGRPGFQGSDYNATILSIRHVHDDLAVLRVTADDGRPSVEAGQYFVLGLGTWESRVDTIPPTSRSPALVQRAYSVSCPLLDDAGNLVRVGDQPWFEFYVALVRRPTDDPPSLTPRLFARRPGDRVYLGPRPHGRYSISPVRPDDDVLLCATGTGEAPHNAMLAELLAREHRGRIVSAVCVRFERDLAYREAHEQLERRFPNYRHVALTTREPWNVDPDHAEYRGKRHLQDVLADDGLCEELLGFVPDPTRAHVFLCGNPAMIGLPQHADDDTIEFPTRTGAAEVLSSRGFVLDAPRQAGNVHFEKYW